MVARDGSVWAADGRGACTRIAPDGAREERVGELGGEPNGICFDADGSVIVANLGGSVQRLDPRTGRHAVLARSAGDVATTTPNFPFVDRRGRISSRKRRRRLKRVRQGSRSCRSRRPSIYWSVEGAIWVRRGSGSERCVPGFLFTSQNEQGCLTADENFALAA
jgi:hypothetical protein